MPVEAAAIKQKKKLHVVLLTFEAKGHINPFMNLAKQLAKSSSSSISVTVLFPSKFTLGLIPSSSLEGLDIKLVALPVPGDKGVSSLPPHRITMQGIRRQMLYQPVHFPSYEAPLTQVLEEMLRDPSCIPPSAVVVDSLLHWAAAPVDQLGIPRFVLYTAAGSHLAIGLHLNANPDRRSLDSLKCEAEKRGFLEVPGLPVLGWEDVSKEHKDESDKFFLGEKKAREFLLGAKGILMNTCYALEGKVIDSLRDRYPETKFLPVGPLIPPQFFSSRSDSAAMSKKSSTFLPSCRDSLCEDWLKGQQPRSVLYISFGSWAGISEAQIKELALGLELSGKPFLWVLPVFSTAEGKTEEELLDAVLPEGFRDRIKRRGLVLSEWAPQHLILSHPSVGGFLTHCGWNSVSECVAAAGVPMLAWPFVADQPAICRYIVDDLRIGVDIQENKEGIAVREEVERAVNQLSDFWLRERASCLKEKLREDFNNSYVETFIQCLKC